MDLCNFVLICKNWITAQSRMLTVSLELKITWIVWMVAQIYLYHWIWKQGYWQVKMSGESIPYTVFTVGSLGFYECVRMPFGLTNAPSTFQRLYMESCLGDLHMKHCIIYLDDIIIFSRTPEEHIERLKRVFDKLAVAGLKAKTIKMWIL